MLLAVHEHDEGRYRRRFQEKDAPSPSLRSGRAFTETCMRGEEALLARASDRTVILRAPEEPYPWTRNMVWRYAQRVPYLIVPQPSRPSRPPSHATGIESTCSWRRIHVRDEGPLSPNNDTCVQHQTLRTSLKESIDVSCCPMCPVEQFPELWCQRSSPVTEWRSFRKVQSQEVQR
jgi:hypothetical protein